MLPRCAECREYLSTFMIHVKYIWHASKYSIHGAYGVCTFLTKTYPIDRCNEYNELIQTRKHSRNGRVCSRMTYQVRPMMQMFKWPRFRLHAFVNLAWNHNVYLVGGFKYFFIFTPIWGRWSNLTNIFQMGWNHQLVYRCVCFFS